jgi:hypothetical protein
MTTLPAEPRTTEPTHAEIAAGFRLLADLIEATPNVAVAYPRVNVWCAAWDHDAAREQWREIARAAARMGLPVRKEYSDTVATLEVPLAGITARALANREYVCDRVKVGTELVEELVPDPDAPLVTIPDPRVVKTVEVERDVFEWQCG